MKHRNKLFKFRSPLKIAVVALVLYLLSIPSALAKETNLDAPLKLDMAAYQSLASQANLAKETAQTLGHEMDDMIELWKQLSHAQDDASQISLIQRLIPKLRSMGDQVHAYMEASEKARILAKRALDKAGVRKIKQLDPKVRARFTARATKTYETGRPFLGKRQRLNQRVLIRFQGMRNQLAQQMMPGASAVGRLTGADLFARYEYGEEGRLIGAGSKRLVEALLEGLENYVIARQGGERYGLGTPAGHDNMAKKFDAIISFAEVFTRGNTAQPEGDSLDDINPWITQ